MKYIIRAVLSNAKHPEYGQFTIPFPIPESEYEFALDALASLGIGSPSDRDCRVDEIDSSFPILKRLEKVAINLDEMDYLAKRLDSFDVYEAAQFQSAAVKLDVFDMTDFINLTFSCQQVTVITDFSDLEEIGRQHYLTLQGGSCSVAELEGVDARKVALNLILNDLNGRITPYGVVYDNDMKMEQLYDGQHFPCYLYEPAVMVVRITPAGAPDDTRKATWLPLPCAQRQMDRLLQRSGLLENVKDASIWYDAMELPAELSQFLVAGKDSLCDLNDMALAISDLSGAERSKLVAITQMAKPEGARGICELAKNLEQFEFAANVHTPTEYAKYMIQKSGHYANDPNLDEFYDYERYGKLRLAQEKGTFTEKGYVVYYGAIPLEELLAGDPAEQYQREKEWQMEGLT